MKLKFLLCLFLIGQFFAYGQQKLRPIARDVAQAKTKKTTSEVYSLFTVDNNINKIEKFKEALSKVDVVSLDKHQVKSLAKTKPDFLELSIPYEGRSIFLQLVKKEVVTEEFSVDTDKGRANFENKGVFYHGIINGDNSSVVTVSLFEDDVNAFISSFKLGNVILTKAEKSDDYLIYNDANLKGSKSAFCNVSDEMASVDNAVKYSPEMSKVETTNKRIKLYYEVANDIYRNKGSNIANTVNWIMSIQNNVSTLFYNDGIKVILNKVFVWTVVDPYAQSANSEDALYGFRNYRTSFAGDVGQLLNLKNSFGGLAWVNQLCKTYKYSYSGIDSSYKNVPTYSWTIEVITHEFGHNFGSSHTHACVWNGNNTPIDGCYDPEGNCAKGPIPSKGTIMSYCHLLSNVGINLALGFGDQPAALIRNRVNSSCSNGPNRRFVKQDGTGDGLSWDTAGNLSDVLRWAHDSKNSHQWTAEDPLEIWVAKGYHIPTYQYGGGHSRDRTFVMVKDVRLYGGFNGDETSLDQRKPSINETVLNGDKVSAHVVVSAGDVGVAVLDGFTIWNGRAADDNRYTINGETIDQRYGGGIIMNNSSPIIMNTIIKDNYSVNRGGGVYILNDSKPVFQNVVFFQNVADSNNGDGGAIYTDTNNNRGFLTLINCSIINNSANDGGGIRFNHNIGVKFYNNIFYNNTSKNGSNTLNSELSFNINESDFSSKNATSINNNIFQYYQKGISTLNINPLMQTSHYRLQDNSPAINKGQNSLYTDINSNVPKSSIDADSKIRIVKTTIDLGAVENQCTFNLNITPNQEFVLCSNFRKVSDLLNQLNIPNGMVYSSSSSYSPISSTTNLVSGTTYYVMGITEEKCTSTRVPVKVTVSTVPVPTGYLSMYFCEGQTKLSDIKLQNVTNAKWYTQQTGGTPIDPNTIIVRNTNYYASQVIGDCESTTRLRINVISMNPVPNKPTGDSQQTLAIGKTIGDLIVTGVGLKWYGSQQDLNAATNALPLTTVLEEKTYYVQSVSNYQCKSQALEVQVTLDPTLGTGDINSKDVVIYPIPVVNDLNISGLTKISKVEILDISGKLIKQISNLESKTIDVSSITSGIYMIKIYSDNKVYIRKMIKK